VSMLGTKIPMAGLPEGALLYHMIRGVLVALKAVGERDFVSPSSLAKYCMTL